MLTTHHYEAAVSWSGAATGGTGDYKTYPRTHDVEISGKQGFQISADPSFLGDPSVLNPEECLLVALASCHMLSYLALAARSRINVLSYKDAASGTMEQEGSGGHFTDVLLRPRVTIAAGGDEAKALALHERANKICFIAQSVNFPVRHEPVVEIVAA